MHTRATTQYPIMDEYLKSLMNPLSCSSFSITSMALGYKTILSSVNSFSLASNRLIELTPISIWLFLGLRILLAAIKDYASAEIFTFSFLNAYLVSLKSAERSPLTNPNLAIFGKVFLYNNYSKCWHCTIAVKVSSLQVV